MNATLTIRLEEELATALEQEAAQTGRSRGEIAREAIAAKLQTKGGASAMRRHFGRVRGPADLSTNKTYRRAWTRPRS